MKFIEMVILYWLHLLASVIWIGGIFLILFDVLPSAKEYLGREAGGFMGIISKRFSTFAGLCIITLIITGAFILALDKGFKSLTALENLYSRILSFKLLIVLIMIAIHYYRNLWLNPKIAKLSPLIEESLEDEKEKISSLVVNLQRLSLNLVKINLGLGMLVLILSSALLIL